jgi:hypothetical protein
VPDYWSLVPVEGADEFLIISSLPPIPSVPKCILFTETIACNSVSRIKVPISEVCLYFLTVVVDSKVHWQIEY